MRLLLGMTGASGSTVTVRALQLLQNVDIKVHLIMSAWGKVNLKHECSLEPRDLEELAHRVHNNKDLAAANDVKLC